MKKIETIRCYRSNIEIIPTEGEMIDFCFDGMDGEYTRQEFVEYNDWMQEFSKRDQQRIMDEIEGQFNVDFFLSDLHNYTIRFFDADDNECQDVKHHEDLDIADAQKFVRNYIGEICSAIPVAYATISDDKTNETLTVNFD